MAERKFALGGRGRGPLVPTGGEAKVVAFGMENGDVVTVRSEHGDTLTFDFQGLHFVLPGEWSFVSIDYEGDGRPIFFVENA